jgi:hypothetical protein
MVERAGALVATAVFDPFLVIPAEAGIQLSGRPGRESWIPAFAGMTFR